LEVAQVAHERDVPPVGDRGAHGDAQRRVVGGRPDHVLAPVAASATPGIATAAAIPGALHRIRVGYIPMPACGPA
jgi:hypothetical protein